VSSSSGITAVGLGVNTNLVDCWVVVAAGVAVVVGTGVDTSGVDSTGATDTTGVDWTGVEATGAGATGVIAGVAGWAEPELPKFDPAVVLAPEEIATFFTMTVSPSILVTLTSTVVVPKPAEYKKKL
jgi:hypothetical protein